MFSTPWPGPSQAQIRVGLPEFGYYAVEFATGSVVDAGLLSNIEASATHGIRLGAISETAGCFDVADEYRYVWGRSGGIVWDLTGENDGCDLKPNTTYYWNMTFTDGINPDLSSCSGSYCETYLVPINPD